MMHCLKCQKEYNPKRSDKLFCGSSCGNAYRQKQKRDAQKKAKLVEQGLAVEKELTEEEVHLWSVLLVLANQARKLLLDNELPEDKKPADIPMRIYDLLVRFRTAGEDAIMKNLGIRFDAQEQAKKAYEALIKSKQEKRTAQSNSK